MAMPRPSLRSTPLKKRDKQLQESLRKNDGSLNHDEEDSSVDEDLHNEGFDETDRVNITSSPISSCSPKSNKSWSSGGDSFVTVKSDCIPKRRSISKNTKLCPSKKDIIESDRHHNLVEEKRIGKPAMRNGLKRLFAIFGAFLFCMMIFCMLPTSLNSKFRFLKTSKSSKNEKLLSEIHSDLKSGLKMLKQEFEQTRHLWVQLVTAVNSIMEKDPPRPAVILTLVPSDSTKTSVCLLHSIARITSDAFGDHDRILIDVKSLQRESLALKKDIHSSLSGLENSHVAIVHNIEKIPGDAAMVFHSFCDTDNAPHKRVLYLLTLEVAGNYSSVATDRLDDTIDNYLKDIWTGPIRDVDVAAIITRIANHPILVKPESSEILKSNCDTV